MVILESLTWLLVGYVAWVVIKKILYIVFESYRVVINEREGYGRARSEKSNNEDLVVRIEKIAEVYYAYQESNDLFLAQGPNLLEMSERLCDRTNTERFIITESTDSAIAKELELLDNS